MIVSKENRQKIKKLKTQGYAFLKLPKNHIYSHLNNSKIDLKLASSLNNYFHFTHSRIVNTITLTIDDFDV